MYSEYIYINIYFANFSQSAFLFLLHLIKSSIKILPRIQRNNDVKRSKMQDREVYLLPQTCFSTFNHVFFLFLFLSTGGSCQVLQHFAKINYVRNATRLDLKSSKPALNLDRPTCFVVCVYVDAHGGPEHERKLVLE